MQIRRVRDDECGPLGELILAAYRGVAGAELGEEYADELRDVETRARVAVVLVAVDDDDTLLGGVTYVPHRRSPLAEHTVEGAASLRMLGVAPSAQSRGVGRALAQACVDRAREAGCVEIVLHSTVWMLSAHRLYERLGFRRAPELDWEPVPDFVLLGFRLPLS